jgi:hypothetical protein
LKSRDGKIVALSILAEAVRRARFIADIGAEVERHSEQEYKNPEHHDQRRAALILRRRWPPLLPR